MRIIAAATLAVLLSSPALAEDSAQCASILRIGQSVAAKIDLLQSYYDQLKEKIAVADHPSRDQTQAEQVAGMLERSSKSLKLVVAAAREAGCDSPDTLVEAESLADEVVEAVRADSHEMGEPSMTASVSAVAPHGAD